jgi:hypothetical protein
MKSIVDTEIGQMPRGGNEYFIQRGALEDSPQFRNSLLELLEKAIDVDNAAKGNVQLLDESQGELRIVAQSGFNPAFLQLFHRVRADNASGCGRALRYHRRVIIPNVAADILFRPYLSVAMANDFRALQSTPIIGTDGLVKGVFSTHFPDVHYLSVQGSNELDRLAAEMAKLIADTELELELARIQTERPFLQVLKTKNRR